LNGVIAEVGITGLYSCGVEVCRSGLAETDRLPTLSSAGASLTTFCIRGFSSFVAYTAALMATAWSEPVPGGLNSRCGPSPLHGAPDYPNQSGVAGRRRL